MKKNGLLCLALFFCLKVTYAQNAFYDAVSLKKYLKDTVFASTNKETTINNDLHLTLNGIDDNLFILLKKYFATIPDTGISRDSITTIIQNNLKANPYFDMYRYQGIKAADTAIEGKTNDKKLDFIPPLSSVSGLDVTKYVNVLAEIMIVQAKKELTVAFFDRFKKFSKENPEFEVLFPKTTDILANLLTYSYPQWLPTLRASFFDDVKMFTYNFANVMDMPRYQNLLNDFPEVRIAIRSLRLLHEIETGASNAADIVKEFASFDEWKNATGKNKNKIESVGSCIAIAALFSESLRNDKNISQKNDVWISAKELKSLFYNDTLFNIYMGLLYQEAKNRDMKYRAADGTSKGLDTILADQKKNLFLFQNKLKEFIDLTGNLNTAYKELKATLDNDEKPSNDQLYNYIKTTIDAIDYSFSIGKVLTKKPIADDYIAVMRKSNDLYKSVYTKQYSQAITQAWDVFSMLNNIIKPQISASLKTDEILKDYTGSAKKEVAGLAKGDHWYDPITNYELDKVAQEADLSKVEIRQLFENASLTKLTDFIEKVKPYALFITNMIEADSEEEIKAALENAILPVGSSTVKKYTRNNLSIQSYLGAFLSTSTGSAASQGTWSDKLGVIAPIGLSYTPGFLSWKRGGALSLFVPLLDIGAVVDYKLKAEPDTKSPDPNDVVVSKDYKIELGQIFSPGIYAVYGFPWNIPVSLGYGTQYGPGLSKIDVNGNANVVNPSWRWNFFLAVDLPLFNLMNKTKYTKTNNNK